MVTKYKTSDGVEIKAGDILVYVTKYGMSDMEVVEKDGELYGEGIFTTHPLSSYFEALDFESIHIYRDFFNL